MDTVISQSLYEKVLEDQVTLYVNRLRAEELLPLMESEAVKIVSKIQDILDDDSLEDSQCFYRIDAIVNALGESGIYTHRHDF